LSEKRRPRVLVAGAGGAIGSAVSRALAHDFDVVALVGVRERMPDLEPGLSLTWRSCEPFSRNDVENAVRGCDYVVYLVHTRLRTARLDQAECKDMDLLIADNVARAASRQGVRRIVYLGRLVRENDASPGLRDRREEVIEALSFYGTPVTVLRAGLVVAPGSHSVRLLVNIATRMPLVLLPRWASGRKQPIAVTDLIRAIRICLRDDDSRSVEYDIGGPKILTVREMLESAVEVFGKRRVILRVPFLPSRLYAWYLRRLDPQAHRSLVEAFVENLGHDVVVRPNPVQGAIEKDAIRPREVIVPYVQQWKQLPPNPREPFLARHMAGLRARSSVRSIQRVALPRGRNATWVADTYFRWLPRFTRLLVSCEVDETGTCRYVSRFPRLNLLTMSFQEAHSSPDRRMYFITGGLLAKGHRALKPRLEFRDVLKGRCTIVALHDFRPVLPWGLYLVTQSLVHLIVMRNFQKYVARVAAIRERTASA